MSVPDQIRPYLDRPLAVLGYGVSGRGLAALLRASGIWFETYDEHDGEATYREFGEKQARHHRLAVYSPGFPPNHPWLEEARKVGCQLVGELDFASLFWAGALIAVTGTNGKTTVAEFLSFAYKRAGINAVAAGNIGYPFSRLCEAANARTTTAVCEVSSFQSESLQHLRPQAVIWTNFAEDHLDRYADMREYFAAKWCLIESLARPRLLVGESVARAAAEYGYVLPNFADVIKVEPDSDIPAGTCFQSYPQRENYLLVRAFWAQEGLSPRALAESAKQFKPPRHRLATVAQIGQVRFWNDSKATNFASAIAALKSFDKPVLWIGGGKSKGGDIPGFGREIMPFIQKAFLIGETAPEMKAVFEAAGRPCTVFKSIDEAVSAAFDCAEGESEIVLSPGFASLDQFSGYAERGIRFEKAVLSLKNSPRAHTSVECAVISEKSS